MNEDVLKMIDTLHARLHDVRAAVEALDREAPEYVGKLDKVDDKLYLLQCEIEKLAADGGEESPSSDDTQAGASAAMGVDTETGAAEPAQAQKVAEVEDAQPAKKPLNSTESSEKDSSKSKELISDDMKENLADAGRAIGNIYRDGKEVITELSGTMGDLKDIFSFGGKKR